MEKTYTMKSDGKLVVDVSRLLATPKVAADISIVRKKIDDVTPGRSVGSSSVGPLQRAK
jgi:hypothetical protein